MLETEITFAEAQIIASEEIERLRSDSRLSQYDDFSPVELAREDDYTWTFVSGSQRLQDEGWIPGALFVRVDKQDGHVWTEREIEQYHEMITARSSDQSARVA